MLPESRQTVFNKYIGIFPEDIIGDYKWMLCPQSFRKSARALPLKHVNITLISISNDTGYHLTTIYLNSANGMSLIEEFVSRARQNVLLRPIKTTLKQSVISPVYDVVYESFCIVIIHSILYDWTYIRVEL